MILGLIREKSPRTRYNPFPGFAGLCVQLLGFGAEGRAGSHSPRASQCLPPLSSQGGFVCPCVSQSMGSAPPGSASTPNFPRSCSHRCPMPCPMLWSCPSPPHINSELRINNRASEPRTGFCFCSFQALQKQNQGFFWVMLHERGAQGAGHPAVPAQHPPQPLNPPWKGKAPDPRAFRIAQAWGT